MGQSNHKQKILHYIYIMGYCALCYSCTLHILLNVAGHLGITWRDLAYYAQYKYWNISSSSMLLQTDLTTTHQSENYIRCNSHCRFSTDKMRHKEASKHTLAHDSRKETHTNKQAQTHRMRMCSYFPLYTHWSTVKTLLCEEMMSFVRIGQQGLLKPVTPPTQRWKTALSSHRGSWHFTS